MTSLKSLVRRDGVRAEATYGAKGPIPDGRTDMNPWRVTLRRKGRRLTVDFFTGPAITDDPDAEGVLDCLLSDLSAGEQSFEEFCSEFGYEEDSRSAYDIWERCGAMAPRVRRFLGDALEEYLRAER